MYSDRNLTIERTREALQPHNAFIHPNDPPAHRLFIDTVLRLEPEPTEHQPRDIRETEAEAVALLCCESLGLPGAEYSRDYIQSWGHRQAFSKRSAKRILRAADQILRAVYSGE